MIPRNWRIVLASRTALRFRCRFTMVAICVTLMLTTSACMSQAADQNSTSSASTATANGKSDEDQVRDLIARYVAGMNAHDVDAVLATEAVCDSSPPGAEEQHRSLFTALLQSQDASGLYSAEVHKVLITGDRGRVWVSARLGSVDASPGWGGADGAPLARQNGEWRLCMG
jgi:ketosteroid isomerase-like protein